MLAQHDSIEQAQLSVRNARSDFRPKVVPNIRGSFGQTDINDQMYRLDLSQRFVNGTEVRVGVGASTAQIPSTVGLPDVRFYNTDATLMLTQPLLKGFGSTVARRSLTSAELQLSDAGRRGTLTEQQVTVEVAAAYFRVVAQEAVIQVSQRSLDRSRQLRNASEAKLDAGLVSQLDVLRAQQLVIQAELQLFDAQARVNDARDELEFLIDYDGDDTFRVESEIPRLVDALLPEDAITMALAQRADLKSAGDAVLDADRQVSYARNQLLPQVDVNLALARRKTADAFARSFGLDGFQLATFFNISMPVDRTPQTVEFQNALINRDRRQRDLTNMRRRIADDVKRGIRDRDRSLRNLVAAETSVQIAQREVDVAKFRYERGLSDNLEVVTAETNLLNAESSRVLTLADLATASLGLRATMGTLDPQTVSMEHMSVQPPAPIP